MAGRTKVRCAGAGPAGGCQPGPAAGPVGEPHPVGGAPESADELRNAGRPGPGSGRAREYCSPRGLMMTLCSRVASLLIRVVWFCRSALCSGAGLFVVEHLEHLLLSREDYSVALEGVVDILDGLLRARS